MDDLMENYEIDLKDLLNVRTFQTTTGFGKNQNSTKDRVSQSTGLCPQREASKY
jgi:hypothetical protein